MTEDEIDEAWKLGAKAAQRPGSAAVIESETQPCERCGGEGYFYAHSKAHFAVNCENCGGTGRVKKAKPQPNDKVQP